jgi:hypothetical protein
MSLFTSLQTCSSSCLLFDFALMEITAIAGGLLA